MTEDMMAKLPNALLHQKQGSVIFLHQVSATDAIRVRVLALPEMVPLITKYTGEIIQKAPMTHGGFQMQTPEARVLEYLTISVLDSSILVYFDSSWEHIEIFQVEMGVDPEAQHEVQLPLRLKVFDSLDQLLFDSVAKKTNE